MIQCSTSSDCQELVGTEHGMSGLIEFQLLSVLLMAADESVATTSGQCIWTDGAALLMERRTCDFALSIPASFQMRLSFCGSRQFRRR